MSNVIDFLERLGGNAELRHASLSDMSINLIAARLDPEIMEAILEGDQLRLEGLLGQAVVCSMQFPAKEDEDEESEETPSRHEEEAHSNFAVRNIRCAG